MPCPDNPFSSNRTSPFLGNYIFHPDRPLDYFLEILNNSHWTAALCGPHGVGKTTLLHTFAAEAKNRGHRPLMIYCSNQTRLLPLNFWKLLAYDVVFLNSAECLYRPLLHLVRLVTKVLRKGLVVTAHAPCGVNPVIQIEVTPWQFEQLVQRLAGTPRHAKAALDSHAGNAREALFHLYDQVEADS